METNSENLIDSDDLEASFAHFQVLDSPKDYSSKAKFYTAQGGGPQTTQAGTSNLATMPFSQGSNRFEKLARPHYEENQQALHQIPQSLPQEERGSWAESIEAHNSIPAMELEGSGYSSRQEESRHLPVHELKHPDRSAPRVNTNRDLGPKVLQGSTSLSANGDTISLDYSRQIPSNQAGLSKAASVPRLKYAAASSESSGGFLDSNEEYEGVHAPFHQSPPVKLKPQTDIPQSGGKSSRAFGVRAHSVENSQGQRRKKKAPIQRLHSNREFQYFNGADRVLEAYQVEIEEQFDKITQEHTAKQQLLRKIARNEAALDKLDRTEIRKLVSRNEELQQTLMVEQARQATTAASVQKLRAEVLELQKQALKQEQESMMQFQILAKKAEEERSRFKSQKRRLSETKQKVKVKQDLAKTQFLTYRQTLKTSKNQHSGKKAALEEKRSEIKNRANFAIQKSLQLTQMLNLDHSQTARKMTSLNSTQNLKQVLSSSQKLSRTPRAGDGGPQGISALQIDARLMDPRASKNVYQFKKILDS